MPENVQGEIAEEPTFTPPISNSESRKIRNKAINQIVHEKIESEKFQHRYAALGEEDQTKIARDMTARELIATRNRLGRLQKEMQVDELQKLATEDPLTGLGNRLSFNHELASAAAEVIRAAKGNMLDSENPHKAISEFAIIYLDANNLKEINENEGHPAGDKYIQGLAKLLQSDQRPTEPISRLDEYKYNTSRLGGDEFAIIIRSNEAGVRKWWERKQALLQEAKITIGAGFQVVDGKDLLGLSNEEVRAHLETSQHMADNALFYAKYQSKQTNTSPLMNMHNVENLSEREREKVAQYRLETSQARKK